MDKIKDMLYGYKKDDEYVYVILVIVIIINVGIVEVGYFDFVIIYYEEGKEKKGFFGFGGYKKVLLFYILFIMYFIFVIVDGFDMDYLLFIMCMFMFMLFFNGLNSDVMLRIL